jgi:metal-dependent amidase/aminoacylase/carboxypeptidase family protein
MLSGVIASLVSEFHALHVSPEWDAGVLATRPGTLLAGSSSVTVEFTGVAGHAGMPHRAVDPDRLGGELRAADPGDDRP